MSLEKNGINQCHQGSLAVAPVVNSVFINVKANMTAQARRIKMGILFTNRKLPSIHSESVPRNRSKASKYSYAEKLLNFSDILSGQDTEVS